MNHLVPPFGQTAAGFGAGLRHVRDHLVVQHPNQTHDQMPQATPFMEGSGAVNGWRGRARHWPGFTAGNGLFRGNRK